jgi:hypothetical protein
MTLLVQLGDPNQSVWFDFDFKSDQTGPLTTLNFNNKKKLKNIKCINKIINLLLVI